MAMMTKAPATTLEARNPAREDLGICLAPLATPSGCQKRCARDEIVRAAFHIIVLCESGSTPQVVDGGEFHHTAGSLLWITPGTAHQMVPTVPGNAVCFTSGFMGMPVESWMGGVWHLDGNDRVTIGAMVDVLSREYSRYIDDPTGNTQAGGDILLRHLLLALLIRIHNVPRSSWTEECGHPVVRQFLDLVEEHYATIHTVEEYADLLGYSTRTLHRICYEQLGATPRQVVSDRLSQEAERLLVLSDGTISSVGRSLGFTDPANFSKFFQRQCGLTPGEFRRTRAH